MVHDMTFIPEDRFDLVAGLTPFALPTLSPEEATHTTDALRIWDEHLADLSQPTVPETKQATQKARLAPITSFVHLYATISCYEVLVATVLGKRHAVTTNLRQAREYFLLNYLFVERLAAANKRLCSQIICEIRNHVLGWCCSAARPGGAPLATRIYKMVNDIKVESWRPPVLPQALKAFFVRPPPPV